LPARAFSLARERAISSVQKRFGFRQTNAPVRKSQISLVRLAEILMETGRVKSH